MTDILNRLRSAETFTVSEANDLAYEAGFHGEKYALMVAALRGGVDAAGSALALVEKMLPGWFYRVCPKYCELTHPKYRAKDVDGHGATPALAILTALFSALEAKDTTP